jgi:hypothetical protein
MATRYICSRCGRDVNAGFLPPRSPLVNCSCGALIHRSVASVASAWSFFFYWVSFLVIWAGIAVAMKESIGGRIILHAAKNEAGSNV